MIRVIHASLLNYTSYNMICLDYYVENGIKYSNVRRTTEEGDSGASICLYKHFVERATDKTHEKLVCTSNFVTFKHKIILLYGPTTIYCSTDVVRDAFSTTRDKAHNTHNP